MTSTFLITGGAGNLACQLTFDLTVDGNRVVLFDQADRPVARVADSCEYIRGDITQPDDIVTVIREHKPNVILHFASLLSGKSEEDRQAAWRVNMDGTFGLFEAAVDYGVETVFFPSSLAAFGGTLPNPLPEDFPQWPTGFYGVTKSAVERLGVYYHHKHGLDFRCIRLPVVVSTFAPAGAASAYASRAFVESVRTGRFLFKVRPETRPSIIYVKDALRAMTELLRAPSDCLSRRVYNIHAIAPSAAELACAIKARITSADIVFDFDPRIVELIESWPIEIDDRAAREDWNWQPRSDLDAMADDLIRELLSDPI